MLLKFPDQQISGKIYNAGYQNKSIAEIALIVQQVMAEKFPEREKAEIKTTPSDDNRSYRISSEKIKNELNFVPKHTIEDAVRDLIKAFEAGKFTNSMENIRYFNIRMLKEGVARCNV
jgi:nucleoside-diphosphate-sugar epimerase